MYYFDPDKFIILLVKYHDGEATREEAQFIEERLKYSELARTLWGDVKATFGPEKKQKPATHSTGDRLSRVRRSIAKSHYLLSWLPVAAVFILVASGAGLYFYLQSSRPPVLSPGNEISVVLQLSGGQILRIPAFKNGAADAQKIYDVDSILQKNPEHKATAFNRLTVPNGFTAAVKLPDGTRIYIDAATVLQFPSSFHGGMRELWLEGEAYFMVAPDPGRPLVVHTTHGDIIALGTSFNVNTYDGALRAALHSGIVLVKTSETTVRLSPGQAAARDMTTGLVAVETTDNTFPPEWVRGRYLFANRTLAEVCRTAERLYDTKVIFDSSGISGYRYTGAMHKNQPMQSFAELISRSGKVVYYFDREGRLHFKQAGILRKVI